MTSRAYLSIGDVLTLLREEFPDVTISKIRFLESQGLVNPERSPSGYRKFYEHDVERLRWVLRQQREHFLPLKVIRDRLATEEPLGEEPVPAAVGAPNEAGALSSAGIAGMPATREPLGVSRITSGRGPSNGDGSFVSGSPDDDLAAPVGALRSRSLASTRAAAAPAPSPVPPAPAPPAPAPVAVAAAPLEARPSHAAASESPGQEPSASDPPAVPGPRRDPERPGRPAVSQVTEPAAPASTDDSPERSPGGPKEAATVGPQVPPASGANLSPGLSGASLTLEELCASAGLSAEQVAALTSFGLLEPLVVAGVEYYDEEALTVGRLAASFARYGIEPRHLRLYRNAADREIGLVEQVITPLLRQRNPESRQRAVEAAGDIARLGEGLRAALVRRALREALGT